MPKKPYKCCIDCDVFNDALDLKIAKKRIEVYLEALEWIEDSGVACWDAQGKAVSAAAVAKSAREKARRIIQGTEE